MPKLHTTNSFSIDAPTIEPRINIQQKLQEKKQKQLAELKLIEEEIKQGKLNGPTTLFLDASSGKKASLLQEPIPLNKKHGDIPPVEWWKRDDETNNEKNLLYAAINANSYNLSRAVRPTSTSKELHSRLQSPNKMVVEPLRETPFEMRSKKCRKKAIGESEAVVAPRRPVPPTAATSAENAKFCLQKRFLRLKTQTPEILLTPHGENSCVYYKMSKKERDTQHQLYHENRMRNESTDEERYDSNKNGAQSDVESQVKCSKKQLRANF